MSVKKAILRVLLLAVFATVLRAGAQQPMRLIGQCNYNWGGAAYTLTDTTGYIYHGYRGSNMKTGEYLYDTAIYHTSPVKTPAIRWLRTYDGMNRAASLTNQAYINGTWRNRLQYSYSYTGAGNYDTVYTRVWDTIAGSWKLQRIQHYRYSAGRLDTVHWLMPAGTLWITEAWDSYTYNSGKLVKHKLEVRNDSLVRWDVWQIEDYHYNGAGNMDTSVYQSINMATLMLENIRKNVYEYDVSNRQVVWNEHAWHTPSSSWQGVSQHYYTYTTHGDTDLETINMWDISVQQWGPFARKYYYYDASYNVTAIIEKRFYFPTYENSGKEEWLYNNLDLPISHRRFTWYAPTNFWQPETGNNSQKLYYYETYDSTASIVAHSIAAWADVYPNPANDMVTVQLKGKNSTAVMLSLYGTDGRLLDSRRFEPVAGGIYRYTLPQVPDGLYMLYIASDGEEMTKRLVIQRQ